MKQDNRTVDPPVLPGLLMRKARNECSLSVVEVAEALGVTERIVKALESDDYQRLPAKVYVRGYMRRYCALLDMDEEPVLQSYEHLSREEDNEGLSVEPRRLLDNRNFKLGLIGAGVLTLLLVAALAFAKPAMPLKRDVLTSLSDVE
ncbi:MAG TPA: hypothetical protein DCF62_08995 [Porticoccaceae bacterium]|nr:hypothetical protein [Porticoccaceae bacterium]